MTHARSTLLFNPYLATLGGGERFIYAIANHARTTGDHVTIAAPVLPEKSVLAEFGFDVSFDLVEVGEDEITEYSSGFDRLIYLTNYVPQETRASQSHLIVQFPFDSISEIADAHARVRASEIVRRYNCIVYSAFVQRWLQIRWHQASRIVSPFVEMGSHDASKKESLILAVGRFFDSDYSKRQDVLVEAYKQLPEPVQRQWSLSLAGGCKNDEQGLAFVERLKAQAAGHNISFHVNASQEALHSLYNKARLFWHASGYGRNEQEPQKAEHFGMATVEAMSYGCVPLVYSDGGQTEIVDESVGRLWKTTAELSRMSTELVNSPEQQEQLATRAATAAHRYAPAAFTAACDQVFTRQPQVATIILGYNSREYVAASIESVLASRVASHVYFVDNDSRDGSEEYVRDKFNAADVTVIQTGKNLGYAGGNNVGIREALKANPDFILVLNPDTVLDVDCIGRMIDAMDMQPTVGLVSPKVMYAGGEKRIWYAGSTMDWERGISGHNGCGAIDDGTHDILGPTARACGAAMLLRTTAFHAVGPMEEGYFLYFEEVDWSERFKRAGFDIWFVPAAVCYHAVGSSTGGENSALLCYYTTRNNLLFMSRFGGDHEAEFRRYKHGVLWQTVKSVVKRPRPSNLLRLGATLKGFTDFYLGRFGRRW